MLEELILEQNTFDNEQFFYDDSFIDYTTISVNDFFYDIMFENTIKYLNEKID